MKTILSVFACLVLGFNSLAQIQGITARATNSVLFDSLGNTLLQASNGTVAIKGISPTASGSVPVNLGSGNLNTGGSVSAAGGLSGPGSGITGLTSASGAALTANNGSDFASPSATFANLVGTGVNGALVTNIKATNITDYFNNTNWPGIANQSPPETNYSKGVTNLDMVGRGGYITDLPTKGYLQRRLMPQPYIGLSAYFSTAVVGTPPTGTLITNMVNDALTNGLVAGGVNLLDYNDFIYQGTRTGGHLVANTTNFPQGFTPINAWLITNGIMPGAYMYFADNTGHPPNDNPGTLSQNIETDVTDFINWKFEALFIDYFGAAGTGAPEAPPRWMDMLRRVDETAWNVNTTNYTGHRGMIIDSLNNNDGVGGDMLDADLPNLINILPNFGYPSYNNIIYAISLLTTNLLYSNWTGPGFTPYGDLSFNEPFVTMRLALGFLAIQGASTLVGIYDQYGNYSLLESGEWNAIQQDPAVLAPKLCYQSNGVWVYERPLGYVGSPTNALWALNTNSTVQTITLLAATNLGLSSTRTFTVRDPLTHQTLTNFSGSLNLTVQSNDTAFVWEYPADTIGTYGQSYPSPADYPPNKPVLAFTNGQAHLLVNNDTADTWIQDVQLTIPAAFDPASIPGLAGRYDFSMEPNQKGGTFLSGVEDRSGYLNPFTPADTGRGGAMFTNNATLLNGRAFGAFLNRGGTTPEQGMALGSSLFTNIWNQPITIFMVATIPTNNGQSFSTMLTSQYDNNFGKNPFEFFHDEVDFPGQQDMGLQMYSTRFFANLTTATTGSFHDIELVINGASSAIRTNGVTAGTGSVGAGSITNMALAFAGLPQGSPNYQGVFNIAYMLVYTNHVLTSAEESNVEGWLNTRFQIHSPASDTVQNGITTSGTITGNGSGLTNLPAAAITNLSITNFVIGYRAGFTNIANLASSVVVTFRTPMPASVGTNYAPQATFLNETLGAANALSCTALTANGFTINIVTGLTGSTGVAWSALQTTQ